MTRAPALRELDAVKRELEALLRRLEARVYGARRACLRARLRRLERLVDELLRPHGA